MHAQVERFFEKAKKWNREMNLLREIVLTNKLLEEDLKWMHPCYTYKGKNIVLIHAFKEYCALLFHKGALLKDPKGILVQQTENVQSARQIRFISEEEVSRLKAAVKAYIKEAIEIEKSGRKIEMKTVKDYAVPEEFQKALNEDSALHKAFYALTPGRQKGYLFFFSQAKQAKTRELRIEKYYDKIIAGKGLDD